VAFALTWLGFFAETDKNNGIISFTALKLPDWIHGLFIAALLSAIISSGTTLLNAAMILCELTTGNLNKKNALKITQLYIIIIGISSIVIALFVTSIIQTLLFALTFFSGAFFVPTLAGLLNLKVNKKNVVFAILTGGLVAFTGKIIQEFLSEQPGNIIIFSAYLLNASILFFPIGKNKLT
jgi:SSS family solute:Na+ symporter